MDKPPLSVEVGAISRIVLDRPHKQNAMTVEMGQLIARAVDQLNAEPAVRVVLFQGAGRAFCAGGDFSLIEDNCRRTPEENRRNMVVFYSSYLSVLRLRAPSIAVLHGAAVGAGLCLAMACDLRLASSAAKLGANFVRIGLHPGMGCSVLLPRLVGPAKAAELMLSGKLIRGDEAERIGLVNRAVPQNELPSLVEQLAEELSAAAPIAVAQTKASLLAPLLRELSAALEREAGAQAIDFTTADVSEAIEAFREGRTPSFTGS